MVEKFAVRTETLKNVEYGMAHVVQPSVKRSDQIILSRIQTPNLSKTLVVHIKNGKYNRFIKVLLIQWNLS